MAEVERQDTQAAPAHRSKPFTDVEPLRDVEEQPRHLLQLMYEQAGAVRRDGA
ncbi:MAG: hypothetical protein AB2385_04675 [Symbiobacterium sp.]|uniref:hypothetical protein n=1 Tax=Symbiobacterium sp. TaxID=1971213 RepID=UPI003464252D